jgi:hypothetical protein
MRRIVCPICGRSFASLGYMSHRAAHYRRRMKEMDERVRAMGATLRKLDDGRWECCVPGSPDQYVGDRPADAVSAAWTGWVLGKATRLVIGAYYVGGATVEQ